MAYLSLKGAILSAQGSKRFDQLADIAALNVADLLDNFSYDLKERIASFAPSEEEERYHLSLPGNDYDLYKREGGFLYLREAIITEDTKAFTVHDIVTIRLGNSKKINPLIGFAWWHGYGKYENKELRSTADPNAGEVWSNLLEMWEYGGAPFTITPRDPDDALTIAKTAEGSVVVDSVTKTIPGMQPYNMYGSGGYYSYITLRKRLYDKLKEVISYVYHD